MGAPSKVRLYDTVSSLFLDNKSEIKKKLKNWHIVKGLKINTIF